MLNLNVSLKVFNGNACFESSTNHRHSKEIVKCKFKKM